MNYKICPLRSLIPPESNLAHDTRCISEQCAWWCKSHLTTPERGACAVALIPTVIYTLQIP